MSELVVFALVRKRAELAGEIENTYAQLRKIPADVENPDATLQMFDPTCQIEAIKPKAFRPLEDWSKWGEMTRIVLSIPRQAAEPLTTRDIAHQLLVERALDRKDKRLMTKRVGVALWGRRNRGIVESEQGP